MKKILNIFGTRPEAIKMAPVIKELEKHPDQFNSRICVTAQHRQMLDQVLNLFQIKPDYDLDIMKPGQDLFDVTCSVLYGLKAVLKKEQPDFLIVHGDTTTTMAASLAAFYCGIPVGHVEAGLRTRNKRAPFPEEINRRVTGVVADFHFAPTVTARNNLLCEGVPPDTIFVTGNTVIDTLLMALEKIRTEKLESEIIGNLIDSFPSLTKVLTGDKQPGDNSRIILVTGHRRENFGQGFKNICQALKEVAANHPGVEIIYPVHLNPNVQQPVHRILKGYSNIHLIDPIDYLPFIYLMNQSYMIITDSGGIQEEAPSLGKPVLIMRDTTERPEAVESGSVKLVGTDINVIVKNATQLLTDKNMYSSMAKTINPYGDGNACKRIVCAINRII
ncbi:MAG: UDP-N-acetylglucosamine 2-epimerase (non-hydrolyzing) [Paludibacter sp.]|nr:UDP-N-acetylglucosamine 2-epimerase (non-hydrolyzing) [Paludibacter sp.]MDD4072540.1 UDP-N-acetylglucosamine 2-epimerase (non-hydrolyzing) [Desulfobacterales bacterium]MDD4428532.1 UDP-N-acetylglucosamine 2-epimerase (non-hydrolyzing) [Paludibacter sp.]